jgi:hypothetical protein
MCAETSDLAQCRRCGLTSRPRRGIARGRIAAMLSGSRSTLGLLGGQGFFGTVLTLILPGAVGAAPWTAVIIKVGASSLNHEAWEGATAYRTSLLSVLLVGSALLCGMLFHELGTYVEVHVFDEHPQNGTKERHLREWHAFLRTAYERVPVGHRYLRIVLQKMFFELSISGAFASLGIGLIACHCVDLIRSDWPFTLALAGTAWTVACFSLHAAEDSHGVLASTRHVLLQGIRSADKRARDRGLEHRASRPPTRFRYLASPITALLTTIFAFWHWGLSGGSCSALLFPLSLSALVLWRACRACQLRTATASSSR